MKNLILIILLLIPVNLMAKTKWETHEIILQGTFYYFTAIDLMQTYTFLYKEPYISEGHAESNLIMGRHPSKTKFFIIGIGWMALHTGISHGLHYLPKPINRIAVSSWQMFWIGAEIDAINHNYRCGVRINF